MAAEEPLILAVDTACSCSSIAITSGDMFGGKVLATLSLNAKLTHSRRLLTGIDWLLQENGVELAAIDGLTVGLGPGSFTGLRIGMATMKGLSTAMNKPLLGVSTLDGLAFTCSGEGPLCALLDARKQEVYRRWYQKDARGVYRPHGTIKALSPEAFVAELTGPCQLVGDGVFVCRREILAERNREGVAIAPLPLHSINAASLAFLGAELLQKNEIMDLDSAVPLYVRASDAELSLQKKKSGEP